MINLADEAFLHYRVSIFNHFNKLEEPCQRKVILTKTCKLLLDFVDVCPSFRRPNFHMKEAEFRPEIYNIPWTLTEDYPSLEFFCNLPWGGLRRFENWGTRIT